jgi:transcription elongation factor Elf1
MKNIYLGAKKKSIKPKIHAKIGSACEIVCPKCSQNITVYIKINNAKLDVFCQDCKLLFSVFIT